MKRDARDPVRHLARRAAHQRSDLARELLRHAFVSVERQDPVVPRNRRGVVLLIDVAGPVADDHAVGVPLRDPNGLIGAEGVDDDDLVGKGDGRQRVVDACRFVLGDDGDRELRHSRSVADGIWDSGLGIWVWGSGFGTGNSNPKSQRVTTV